MEKFERDFISEQDKSFLKGKKLLVALSVGVDSIALFHILNAIKSELDITLGVAHVNHGFRKESEEEAKFAESLVSEHEVSFHFKKLSNFPNEENKSAWSRKKRYSFLKKLKADNNYDLILTAHHADDQIETFFIKLFANKEIKGVRKYDEETGIFRPLLDVQKSDLQQFVDVNQHKFMEDSSNFENDLIRNRIRNMLLPYIYSNFSDTTPKLLASSIGKVFSDQESLEAIAHLKRGSLSGLSFGSKEWFRAFKELVLSLTDLEGYSDISWMIVDEELKTKLRYNVGRKHAKRFIVFMLGTDVAIELPGNIRVKRSNGGLVFEGMEVF